VAGGTQGYADRATILEADRLMTRLATVPTVRPTHTIPDTATSRHTRMLIAAMPVGGCEHVHVGDSTACSWPHLQKVRLECRQDGQLAAIQQGCCTAASWVCSYLGRHTQQGAACMTGGSARWHICRKETKSLWRAKR